MSLPSVNTWVLSLMEQWLSTGALPLNTTDFTSPGKKNNTRLLLKILHKWSDRSKFSKHLETKQVLENRKQPETTFCFWQLKENPAFTSLWYLPLCFTWQCCGGGQKGAGGVWEVGKKGTGSGTPMVVGSGRKREKWCNNAQYFAIKKMQRGGSQQIQDRNQD